MSDAALLSIPVAAPWVLAVIVAVLDGRRPWVGWLAAAGLATSAGALAALGAVVLERGSVEMVTGGWPAGVGISLRADALGVLFAALSVGVLLSALLYELAVRVRSRTFPALLLLMAAGLTGLFLTADIFNFYVFFEISMVAAYALTSYRERDYQVRAALIFAVVNLVGSVILLAGIGSLYSVTGSLDMAVVAERVRQLEPGNTIVIAAVIFAAFCVKLGLFPFHFWLPAVYVGAHATVAAVLSGALANIGSYGLLRFGAGILPRELDIGSTALLVLGSASVLYGGLQALSRRETSEVLAYSAIGQVGYILLALGVGGPVGFAAAVLYAVVNAVNKTLLFLAADLRGPLVGGAFAVGAFSVVGVPPAAGFTGKLAVLDASLSLGSAWAAAALVALVVAGAALSFLYAFQVYQRGFFVPQDGRPSSRAARALVAVLAAAALGLGLWPQLLASASDAAAAALLGGAR